MKKLLAFLILSSVLLLAGCGVFSQKEAELGFFDEGLLAEVKLTDMPVPDDDDIRHDEDTVYCNMTEEKRIEFANKLASYLIAKDDIYYKGYHYETGCVGGIFFLPEYRFAPLTADADYGGWFAFSLTESLNNGDEYNYSYWNGVTVSVSMKEGKIGSYSYNTVIKINKDPNGIAFYPTEHEHTITYVSAGESGHFENYTCGCPHDHGAVPHYDEDIDLICDACGYDMNADYPPLVDTTIPLRNLTRCEWLNELTAEDIAEIKIISGAVGVAPGNLNNVSSSTDEAVIARIFEEYYQLDTRPISKMEGQIDGGSGVTVKFILKNGTAKELYINNGNYLDTNGDYFELLSTPKFKDTDNATKAYGFITYIGTGTIYDKDNNPVCEIPMDEFEFVVFSGLDAVITGYYYRVETEFGTLWFDSSNDVFYLRFNEVEVDYREYREYYQLIGKNLDELIAEYSATSTD